MGRPSDYSEDKAAQILAMMTEGMSIKAICEADDMPDPRSVYRWLMVNETFRQNYAKAQQDRTTAFAEEMLEIADEKTGDPARDRLRLDTRKWLMSKMDPKRYGDKVEQTHLGADGAALQIVVKHFKLDD